MRPSGPLPCISLTSTPISRARRRTDGDAGAAGPASADDIIVATQNPKGISAGNILPGTIRTIDLLEGQAMLTVFAGEEFYVRLTAAAVSKLGLRDDSRVFLIMKTRSFHLL